VHVKGYVKTVRYLKTSQAATVEHLCEYLRQRISIDTQQEAQCAKPAAMSLEAIKLEDGIVDEKGAMNTPMPQVYAYRIYAAFNDKSMSPISCELSLQQARQKYFAHNPANPITLLFDRDECKDAKPMKDH